MTVRAYSVVGESEGEGPKTTVASCKVSKRSLPELSDPDHLLSHPRPFFSSFLFRDRKSTKRWLVCLETADTLTQTHCMVSAKMLE